MNRPDFLASAGGPGAALEGPPGGQPGPPPDTQPALAGILGAKVSVPPVRGVVRARLSALLEEVWAAQFAVVVAPAGSGKTTAVAHFAAAQEGPVAWYRAEPSDGAAGTVLSHLERACRSTMPELAGGWQSADAALLDLEERGGQPALVVVDDYHHLAATPAEDAVGRLATLAPPSVRVVIVSRQAPGWDLSRPLVSGALVEVGAEALRFRLWEVEQLFRDFYAAPLVADELAKLTRRTEGWAAGLHLYRLVTADKSPGERGRLLSSLEGGRGLAREYLARNVLADLSAGDRAFLVETCVLGRLTGALCDRLLGRQGSEAVLRQLEQRQIFTLALGDGSYRYHEALRAHLEAVLVEEHGEAGARRRYLAAAQLLEEGWPAEALRAYARAGAWATVEALLDRWGAGLADQAMRVVDRLPQALVAEDPWLMLAAARRLLADGNLDGALAAYQRAEAAFGTRTGRDLCQRERSLVATWLHPDSPGRAEGHADWVRVIREGLAGKPAAAAERARALPGPAGSLAEGVCAALAGQVGAARTHIGACAADPDAPPVLALAAETLLTALPPDRPGAGHPGPPPAHDEALDRLADRAAELGVPVLGRLLRAWRRAVAGLPADPLDAHRRQSDGWGHALGTLLVGLQGGGTEVLGDAADRLGGLGAWALRCWALAWRAAALAAAGDPAAGGAAAAALGEARARDVPGAAVVALETLAGCHPRQAAAHRADADRLRAAWRLDPPAGRGGATARSVAPPEPAPGEEPAAGDVTLRCFGQFELWVGGRLVDLRAIKPRARSVLHLLAVHAGRPVHRETLAEGLWPGCDLRTGLRNLQVALSAVRRLLERGAAGGTTVAVERHGDAYRLALPADADVDVWTFERALADARRASADPAAVEAALERALAAYRGDLLPEAGPAEWVVTLRHDHQMEAAGAAARLAGAAADRRAWRAAADACDLGLRIDPYADGLWRLLVSVHETAGDHVAAHRARQRYRRVLSELGIDPAVSHGGA